MVNIEFLEIIIAILIRLIAGTAAYFTVIRPLLIERKSIPVTLRSYNTKLIISVSTFIITCFGTSLFHLCRIGIIQVCIPNTILNDIALFNSLGLLAAWYVMFLLVRFKPEIEEKDIEKIKTDVKIIGQRTKRMEKRSEEIDKNTAMGEGKVMRGRSKKSKA